MNRVGIMNDLLLIVQKNLELLAPVGSGNLIANIKILDNTIKIDVPYAQATTINYDWVNDAIVNSLSEIQEAVQNYLDKEAEDLDKNYNSLDTMPKEKEEQ